MKILQVEGSKKPLFNWCPNVEQGALDQITSILKLPFVEHGSLMADAHLGMQMPIGGVVATNNVIVPNWVGVDEGCGMIAVKTNLTKSQLEDMDLRKRIHHSASRGVPMGFSHNTQKRMNTLRNRLQNKVNYIFDKTGIDNLDDFQVLKHAEKDLWSQLGTLGGGNHFMEVDYDEDDMIWIVIHSGSRNMGKKICEYFNRVAEEENKKWHSIDTGGIPFLPVNTPEGKGFLAWLDFALRFAYLNRAVMMNEVKEALLHEFPNVEFEPEINIHHNYVVIENHFGKNVWVHRKGATSAKLDETGIIPGSMGTATYITKGLGNTNSLMSCSHGAGRKMGRKAFNVQANTPEMMEKIKKSMEGIVYTKFAKETNRKRKETGNLDVSEASDAYKNIEDVMGNQTDLVKPIHRLLPYINWKDAGGDCEGYLGLSLQTESGEVEDIV